MLSKNILYCGSTELPPDLVELKAGPLTMWFDPKTAFLKWLRLGDHEVVRGIYAAVRNENWRTILPVVSLLEQDVRTDSFRLQFDVRCQSKHVDYAWQGLIIGEATGQLTYSFAGEAKSAFLRNRIGLCVLHPITECSGKPCTVQHVDGTEETIMFPRSVAPWQPFLDVKTLAYEAVPGITTKLSFEGAVFETEDQRNWSDASFKTYCTPQRLPKPVQVSPGDKENQSVTLTLHGQVRPILPVLQGRPPQVSISTTPVLPLPPIGLSLGNAEISLSSREIDRLKALALSHLRCDLDLSAQGYNEQLQRGVTASSQLGVPLHLGIILGENPERELEGLSNAVRQHQPKLSLWLVFRKNEDSAGEKWVSLARQHLQGYAPNVLWAAGTLHCFTELNRNRPLPDSSAFPVFSVTPQVHAFDNNNMIENLAGQAWDAESAREFSSKPVVISPITLRMRAQQNSDLSAEDWDTRQASLFGAGWTLGSIARLAATGNVHSLTYYEIMGCRGIMQAETGSPTSEAFPSLPGSVYPCYHVFADIAEWPIKQIYPTHSSHPLQVEGLTLVDNRGRRRILVSNLTSRPIDLKIKTGTCRGTVRYLDETNAEEAMISPETFRKMPGSAVDSIAGKTEVKLLPYALARIDTD